MRDKRKPRLAAVALLLACALLFAACEKPPEIERISSIPFDEASIDFPLSASAANEILKAQIEKEQLSIGKAIDSDDSRIILHSYDEVYENWDEIAAGTPKYRFRASTYDNRMRELTIDSATGENAYQSYAVEYPLPTDSDVERLPEPNYEAAKLFEAITEILGTDMDALIFDKVENPRFAVYLSTDGQITYHIAARDRAEGQDGHYVIVDYVPATGEVEVFENDLSQVTPRL